MTSDRRPTNILVTGGGGYIGCVLVPKLLKQGYNVTVLDRLLFGPAPLNGFIKEANIHLVEGDLRQTELVRNTLRGRKIEAVIHLAAVSNDPCSELNPDLTKAINHDAVMTLIKESKDAGVFRFVNASSATVYGIKEEPEVTEDLVPEPITIYGKYKLLTEHILNEACSSNFTGVSLRSATVCGYSPRMRLDLVLNILTHHAVKKGLITVFGGDQMRPLVHIEDLTDLYIRMLTAPTDRIQQQCFNVCRQNYKTIELAQLVKDTLKTPVEIKTTPTDDPRSYRLSGARLAKGVGFTPARPLEDAIADMAAAFSDGRIGDSEDPSYYNIRTMKNMQFE